MVRILCHIWSSAGFRFGYTIFGQLVRGFDVLTNSSTRRPTARQSAAEEIITGFICADNFDTVLTLAGTNAVGSWEPSALLPMTARVDE